MGHAMDHPENKPVAYIVIPSMWKQDGLILESGNESSNVLLYYYILLFGLRVYR